MIDARVLDQLVEEIESFDGDVRTLGALIADLDAVWSAHVWEEARRKAFRREWGRLEEIYATAVERRPISLSATDQARIHEVLDRLRSLLPQISGNRD